MLSSLDSWYAVARAIDVARGGSSRRTAMPAISAAFSACSVESSTTGRDLGPAPLGVGQRARRPVDGDTGGRHDAEGDESGDGERGRRGP